MCQVPSTYESDAQHPPGIPEAKGGVGEAGPSDRARAGGLLQGARAGATAIGAPAIVERIEALEAISLLLLSGQTSLVHDNEKLLRDAYDAMARGDGRVLGRLLKPTSRWVIAGHGALSGTYTGPDEIFGLWKAIAAQAGGGLRLEVEDVLANDRRAIVLVRAIGERSGRTLDERQVARFDISDRAVDTATFIYEDSDAYDAFWA